MEYVLRETPFVTGFDRSLGGSGDPSPVTALGVLHGMNSTFAVLHGITLADESFSPPAGCAIYAAGARA
jgi:glutamate dehydrogenase/leucine dehydrogenase